MEGEKLYLKLQNIKKFFNFECLREQGGVEQKLKVFIPLSECICTIN